jgi:hypothetical protein
MNCVKADLLEKALALDKTIAEDGLWLDMSLGAKLDAGKDYVILGCLEPVKGEFRSIGFAIAVGSKAVYGDGMYIESNDVGNNWDVHMDWDSAFKIF